MLDLPMAEYQAFPGYSRSFLCDVLRSPAYAKWKKEHPITQTPAMKMGSALHTLVLEPHLFDSQYATAKVDGRTTQWKQLKAHYESHNITLLDEDVFANVVGMRNAIAKHSIASKLLTNGVAEKCIFQTDPETQLPLKIRPDYLLENIIVDVKTANDSSPEAFMRISYDMEYHIQAAMYSAVASLLTGQPYQFVFVVVENKAPYQVVVYYADEKMLSVGNDLYRQALDTVLECEKTGVWPGIPEQLYPLSLPPWAIRRFK